MIKRIFIIVLLSILLVLSCTYYFRANKEEEIKPVVSKSQSVIDRKLINKKELTITYFEGNMIDEVIKYGNKVTKLIKIENNNNEKVSFSIKFKESMISNQDVTYYVSYSNNNEVFEKMKSDNNKLLEDQTLYYNLGVEANSSIYFKVDFLANNTTEETTLKGILSIDTNLSDKELFLEDFKIIHEVVKNKVYSVNGIETKGYYTINLTSLSFKDLNYTYRGIVLIDAKDYSLIKYIYNIYNDKVMLLNYNYDTELKQNLIKKTNKNEIEKINEETVCTSYTNKECTLFGTLPKSNKKTTKQFTDMVNDILSISKENLSTKTLDTKSYIYDINSITSKYNGIKGYIIVDNRNNKKDIYITISDGFYSVLGYNYSKSGEVKERSGTLRMYVELTYNMAAETKEKACNFVSLKDCISQ